MRTSSCCCGSAVSLARRRCRRTRETPWPSPQEHQTRGSHRCEDTGCATWSEDQAQLPTQGFSLSREAEFPGYYRLIAGTPWAGRYLGQEGGARDARMVLWPAEAVDQLWRPVYQGDGTWTLENMATEQATTATCGARRPTARAGRS
ncbi:hypothetical protein ABT061_25600 [Streptosporangium sp. NPDC002544]|uniref:hypothetical protein n=1 Tax=Streptosporangium sp. NPDC002544 TaxID=3154538 RepID=UPI003320288A